ncbi:MAG: DUF3592 domain-containing protein [bacterium]|nr:DUF3592 domain-containing protein [bacterium]
MNLKTLIFLLLAALCLFYPLSEFKEACNLSRDGLMEEAVLTVYEPEVFGGGAGRRYVEDWYVISYSATRGRFLSGTRSVAVGEGFDKMINSPPLKIGDRVPVLYLPSNPAVMRIKPLSRSPSSLYNSHSDVALFYFMKLMAFILILLVLHGLRKKGKETV